MALPEKNMQDLDMDYSDILNSIVIIHDEEDEAKLKKEGKQQEEEVKQKEEIRDNYDITLADFDSKGPSWSELDWKAKFRKVNLYIWGTVLVIGLLYIFICSLDVLTSAFQLLSGRSTGHLLANSDFMNNPVADVMLGVLITVLLQSSSTSTSIVVSMVGANILKVQQGIYIIMGANIGTSVTNTIVALAQSDDINTFRRAFAGATVHDMFNWLTVCILLPIEATTHYLFYLTEAMVQGIVPPENYDEPQFLKVITKPLTDLIIKVDKSVITAVAQHTPKEKYPLCKFFCIADYVSNQTIYGNDTECETARSWVADQKWTLGYNETCDVQEPDYTLSWDDVNQESNTTDLCGHLFTGCGGAASWCNLSDEAVGGILLAFSLTIMLTSIIIMVKVLTAMMKGPMARAIQVGINADFPGCWGWLTGYVAILIGAGVTMLVQSSSVFTSTMTPLVGMGLITVERMYPLTLGANIGTTITSILAALAADPTEIRSTMQVALAHLFFNLSGIAMFYPAPIMRRVPVRGAKFLGETTANYRWFALAYLIILFFCIPLVVLGLSMAGLYIFLCVMIPVLILIITIIVIKVLQTRRPRCLPKVLRTWEWLPLPLRSLEPWDRIVMKTCFSDAVVSCCSCGGKCCKCCVGIKLASEERDQHVTQEPTNPESSITSTITSECNGHANPACAFEDDNCSHSSKASSSNSIETHSSESKYSSKM